MLRSRVIPCLLVHNNGLVKTEKFSNPKYIGDPINAVRIFNEKKVDEIFVIDIDCTSKGKEPDLCLIANIASECRMPLCYGGGVKDVKTAQKIISLGVEKIALSSAAINDLSLLKDLALVIGRQSVVVVIDVKKNIWGRYDVYTHNAKRKVKRKMLDLLHELETIGVGEIVVNSIDKDGTTSGYDLDLIDRVRSAVSCPITALGGASSDSDIVDLIDKYKIIGASAGSMFVFKGKYKAVLLSYISENTKQTIRSLSEKVWN